MIRFCSQAKKWSVILAFLGAVAYADGFDQSAESGYRYGPNLSWGLMGNAPFVWGQWLPQMVGKLHYVWLEPLEQLEYGARLSEKPVYLKMIAELEVSPFYGGYMAGLGIRPFKMNPQVEVDFVYQHYIYFRSNLEMVTADVAGEGRIAESWNADYVVDNVWEEDAEVDYCQLFNMGLTLEYFFMRGSLLGAQLHYILTDISTDFDGKSYDYQRNMPVFSRDFIVEIMTYGRIPLNKNIAVVFETSYYHTGYLRNGSTVEKESLSYGRMMIGPHVSWDNGFRSFSLEVGAWKRGKKRFYDGSVPQQFMIQLEYQGYFSFPAHVRFTE